MIWIWFIGLCPVLQFWGVVISAGSFNVQNPWSRLVALMVFMPVVRFGEAANPGPDDAIFVLGTANPSGLRSKAPFVASQMAHGDMWAFSETHLCSRELSSFNAGLKFAESPFAPMIGGFPVPVSRDNTGAWKGVGVLSRTPVRHVPQDWPTEIAQSSRIMIMTSLIDSFWLTGSVVYGEPDSKHYPLRLQHTEALLQAAIASVGYLSSGPRFIAGDWNVGQGELPAFDALAQLGFKDLQDLATERWGISPKMTCKSRTRKDFCYVSPELQELLLSVSIIDDLWPDHSVIQGHFYRLSQSVPRDIWPSPRPLPWPAHWDLPADFWATLDGGVDVRYAQLWSTIEAEAIAHLPFSVGKQVRGRAQTMSTRSVKSGLLPHIKMGRNGEFQPHFHGSSVRYSQWVRQVRRLQAFCRSRTDDGIPSQHSSMVWGSILRAHGFVGGFPDWWKVYKLKVHGAPVCMPWLPPVKAVALTIFDSLVMNVREFEKQLKSNSRQYARLRRAQMPNMIFRDLKHVPANGVDYLLQPMTACVTEVRNEDCSIVVDPPQFWIPDQSVMCQGRCLSVIHAEPDCLWLDSVDHIDIGSVVAQLRCTGSKQELESAFVDAWQARWDRHKGVPYDRWHTILSFARQKLRPIPMSWPSLDASKLTQIIGQKRRKSAGGLDGVTVCDLQHMPFNVHAAFCDMFAEAEATGDWPSQLLQGKVVCLAKTEHPSTVGDYRPITILGMLYRIWSSYQAQHAIRALDRYLPDALYGCRPARFAGQVWSQLLWAVESAVSHGVALTGLIADLQKAFNHIPRIVVFEAAALLGLPMPMLTAWAGALTKVGRRFQLGPNLTNTVYSSTGMPEGDGLSCLGMLIIDVLFHAWHVHFFPLCQPVSYVDDWTILTTSPGMLEGIQRCLIQFTEALDMLLDAKKTFAWSVCGEGRKVLASQGFKLQNSCRVLGAHVQISHKHTNDTQMKRIDAMQAMWSRLKLSASPYELKVRAIRAAAWPRGLHAIAATTIASQTFSSLRSAAMKGLNAAGAGCNAMIHLGLIEQPTTDPHFLDHSANSSTGT